jgi:hypothetical protein
VICNKASSDRASTFSTEYNMRGTSTTFLGCLSMKDYTRLSFQQQRCCRSTCTIEAVYGDYRPSPTLFMFRLLVLIHAATALAITAVASVIASVGHVP